MTQIRKQKHKIKRYKTASVPLLFTVINRKSSSKEIVFSFQPYTTWQILDSSIFNQFTVENSNVFFFFFSNKSICPLMTRKHCGKRRKCWLPALFPLPTKFSKVPLQNPLKLGSV